MQLERLIFIQQLLQPDDQGSFDGQGRFRYGSESSFSSGAGQAYGGGGGNHGTYRVSGSTVHLTYQ